MGERESERVRVFVLVHESLESVQKAGDTEEPCFNWPLKVSVINVGRSGVVDSSVSHGTPHSDTYTPTHPAFS